ncbi:hypothetical protein IEQ34_005078 [Dendrobium chrysotoxum]|uniref:Uncharacterized protein n=1 Tax=Dendrobium chrysotoxum TaxID=161865 RepID=A0AAV7HBX0_DENCH|nr:hypothetical protein IEQ34_005078 [Dendrobium chrysotoxum]
MAVATNEGSVDIWQCPTTMMIVGRYSSDWYTITDIAGSSSPHSSLVSVTPRPAGSPKIPRFFTGAVEIATD